MIIRSARPEDLPAIAAIQTANWREVYADTMPRHYLEHEIEDDLMGHWTGMDLKPEDLVLVADEDGVVGFIAVWCRPDAFIENLHVKSTARGRGIGAELLRETARRLSAQGHKSTYLWVVQGNHRALKFYERMGGEPTLRQTNDLHGHGVPVIKVEWPEVSTLAGDAG